MAELPTEEDQALWDQYIGPNGVPRLNISAPVAEQPLPSEPTEFDNDPFVRAAERLRRRHQQFPVYGPPAPEKLPSYLIEPDLLEAQQGQHLPTNMAYNDAGIPFNINTGVEIPTVRRPNILPVASTPEGPTFAMPKVLDLVGNIMGGVAGAPVKAGEVLLGSGAVRKGIKLTPVEGNPFTVDAYHGTRSEFEKFKSNDYELGPHFGSSDVANERALSNTNSQGDLIKGEPRVIPSKLDIKNPLRMEDRGEWDSYAISENLQKLGYGDELKSKGLDTSSMLSTHSLQSAKDNLAKLKDFMIEKGYDGIVYLNRYEGLPKERTMFKPGTVDDAKFKNIFPAATDSYIPLKQNTVKGKYNDKILYSDTRNQVYSEIGRQLEKGPFFSALERAVDTAKVGKADAQQWLGYLKNQPGVKSEELSYVLKDLPEGPISKEQLGEIIKGNKVSLDEKVLGVKNLDNMQKEIDWRIENLGETKEQAKKFVNESVQAEIPTKYHGYQLPGGPLSRDTEILTRAGWKRIDSVSIGEEIITRKDENGELEWQAIQAVPTVYSEKLYHFYNQSIDMQVTANHKMVVRKRRRSSRGIFRITAEQLWKTSECVIPLTGNWTGEGSKTLFSYDACDVAEFIGWYLAEGSYKHKNGIKNTIQIAQSRAHNPDNCDRLEALFDRLGVAWKYYGNGYGIGSKSINKELLNLLHNQPTSEGKFIPEFFFNENKNVVNSLLAGLILGDGHFSEEGYDDYGGFRQARKIFFSKSKSLADGVQILALLSGYRASVRKRPTGIYVVGINSKEWNSVDDAKYAIVDYHDFAFCVTVENHCIYVRRNGVAAFTGNSDYKEMLLTLPDRKLEAGEKALKAMVKYGKDSPEYKIAQADYEKTKGLDDVFISSHWPDDPNPVAHIRMNDRMLPDPNYKGPRKLTDADFDRYKELVLLIDKGLNEGKDVKALMQEQNEIGAVIEVRKEATGKEGKLKTLHLEEWQSDLHQAGRDRGYVGEKEKLQPKFDKIEEKIMASNDEKMLGQPTVKGVLKDAVDRKIITKEEADTYKRYTDIENQSPVPDLPFKKNWEELALKRMLHKAATEGYEGLSWTPGEAQALRYQNEVRTKLSSVDWHNKNMGKVDAEGNKQILVTPAHGSEIELTVNKNGEIIKGHKDIKGKGLDSVLGKDIAKQVLEKSEGNIDAKGYVMNSEGMKAAYDKRAVDILNNIVKKYGSKVESREISADQHKYETIPSRGQWAALQDGEVINYYSTKEKAQKVINDKSAKFNKGQPIHYLPITPELRAKAKEGFPLFSTSPTLTAVQHDPFQQDQNKKYKLVPIEGNPFQ